MVTQRLSSRLVSAVRLSGFYVLEWEHIRYLYMIDRDYLDVFALIRTHHAQVHDHFVCQHIENRSVSFNADVKAETGTSVEGQYMNNKALSW